jgi:hypothetical protein
LKERHFNKRVDIEFWYQLFCILPELFLYSFGLTPDIIGGVEFAFSKIPLTMQADYRPGLGLLFQKNSSAIPFFDFITGISIRYTLKK